MHINRAAQAACITVITQFSGCASQSLDQFIEQKIGGDDGVRSTLKACRSAQEAYHLIADTPLDELRGPAAYEKAARMVAEARDSYRRATTYSLNSGKRRLDRNGLEIRDPNKGMVPMSGVTLEVSVMPDYVELKRILSSRGKEIVTFESDMKLVVANDFRPFMIGDEVQIDTDFLLRIRRALNDRKRIDITPQHTEEW